MASLLQRLRTEPTSWGLGDFLAPEMSRVVPWIETAVIMAGVCALGWWAAPDDPLAVHAGFPWPWLAPVLIALRYGVMPGVFGALGLLGGWALFAHLSLTTPELPRGYFLGGVLLTLVCGEFRAAWSNRIERRNEANAYLNERLNRLTRRYLLLRLSHDRIEQELLVKPGSLREALLRLRELSPGTSPSAPLPGVAELLQLAAQYCQLEAAAVHAAPQAAGGRYRLEPPLAAIGKPPPLRGDDPMLRKAMEQRSLVHVAEEAEATHLVVAPLLTSDDRVLGVLAVSQMPFFALEHENLQLLNLLLGYYADVVQGGREAQAVRRQLPGCSWPFAEELVRARGVQRRVGITSHVVVFRFTGAKAHEIAGEVERMRRGLDVIWSVDHGASHAVAVLLPLSWGTAAEGYILRIRNWLEDRYGPDVQTEVSVLDLDIARDDVLTRLRHAMLPAQTQP